MFREESIIVGKTRQTCCSNCAKEVKDLSELELCRLSLQRGYAQNREKIEARVQLITQAEQARPKCLRCGGRMKFAERITLDSSPMRDTVFSSTYALLPCKCTACFRMEFYSPEVLKNDEMIAYLYSQDV